MTAWGELIDAGYRRILGVTVEGIPYAFLEARTLKTDDQLLAAGSPYTTVRALRVRDSDVIQHELDRRTGLGRGRALDVVLALDVLADAGVASLFQTPSLRTKLTADVNGTATTFPVEDTTGFSGGFYVGREYVTFSGATSTSFTGCTRAVAGWAHYHASSTASGYRFATDRPLYWRGRLVTIYEHLVGPDGRALATTACSVGTYCRELWKGYVDEQPQVSGRQMMLRCLPIERLLAQDLGGTAKGEVLSALPTATARDAAQNGFVPIIVTPTDSFYLRDNTDDVETTQRGTTSGNRLMTVSQYVTQVVHLARDALTGGGRAVYVYLDTVPATDTSPTRFFISLRVEDDSAPHDEHETMLRFDAWFLTQVSQERGIMGFLRSGGVAAIERSVYYAIDFTPNAQPYSWLVVAPELEADGQPTPWPSSGYVLLENEQGLEVAAYSEVDTTADPDGLLLGVKLSERALMGTQRLNPYQGQTRITVVAGARGSISEVIETLATSSGTGTRGTLDTLAFGLGLALPEDWFDVDLYPLSSQWVDGVSDDRASVERTVGGWLALMGRCLTQRQQADGYVRIVAASTSIETTASAVAVAARDVMVNTTQAERLFESPNTVRIEDSLRQNRTVTVVRDVPRQQAEGARELSFVAPGINTASALIYGAKMLALADGQLVVTLGVRTGLQLGLGDPCNLNLIHPAIWSWDEGAVALTVPARVIGMSDSLGTGARTLTFLVPGQQKAALSLCPAARVDGYLSGKELTVDNTTGFEAGMVVRVYRRNATSQVERTIAAVTSTTLTLTSDVSSGSYPADSDTWVTYTAWASVGLAKQRLHLFSGYGSFEA